MKNMTKKDLKYKYRKFFILLQWTSISKQNFLKNIPSGHKNAQRL